MNDRLFGTDGIRSHISASHLMPENLARLGRVIGQIAFAINPTQASITISRDTRASGIYIEQALTSGILSAGVHCNMLGILPTAAVACATKMHGSTFGIMISASHNPASDNGLKIFDHLGFKINASLENLIEQHYFSKNSPIILPPKPGSLNYCSPQNNYESVAASFLNQFLLKDLKIVVDCAHGAASAIAQSLFARLGLKKLTFIGIASDGLNINKDCGSEHPGLLQATVKEQKADLGIAFDGDADRALFVNERGEIIDGDAVLALLAIHEQKTGDLKKNTLVATIMSSVALDQALAPYGINVLRTDVGDKFVAQKMAAEGYSFGGENSGHMIKFPETTTGDGIMSALLFLKIMSEQALPASKLMEFYAPTPRLLKNIRVEQKVSLQNLPKTKEAVLQANDLLHGHGRVLFRYSGTENKARLLVEAQNQEQCLSIADKIATLYEAELDMYMSSR